MTNDGARKKHQTTESEFESKILNWRKNCLEMNEKKGINNNERSIKMKSNKNLVITKNQLHQQRRQPQPAMTAIDGREISFGENNEKKKLLTNNKSKFN